MNRIIVMRLLRSFEGVALESALYRQAVVWMRVFCVIGCAVLVQFNRVPTDYPTVLANSQSDR